MSAEDEFASAVRETIELAGRLDDSTATPTTPMEEAQTAPQASEILRVGSVNTSLSALFLASFSVKSTQMRA